MMILPPERRQPRVKEVSMVLVLRPGRGFGHLMTKLLSGRGGFGQLMIILVQSDQNC